MFWFNSWDKTYCSRKIIAILEAESGNGRQLRGRGICTPDGTTKGQLIDAVTAWLKAHKNTGQATATDIIAMALSSEFPCR